MAKQWALIIVTLLWFQQCQGQMCTREFLTTVSDCTGCGVREDGNAIIWIIPDMNFTCNGTVTYWRAAGEFETGGNFNRNSLLSIWRERSNEPGTYDRIGRIELGRCGDERRAPSVTGMSNIYECTLPQNENVAYQPGDIVGIELFAISDTRFRLDFNTNHGSRNYIFNGHSSPVTLDLNVRTETQDLPQISLIMQSSTSSTGGDGDSGQPNNINSGDDMINVVVFVGSVVGGVVGITLLLALVLSITLAVVCLARKHKRSKDSARAKETNIGMTQSGNMADIAIKANLSYVPVPYSTKS